MAVAAVLAHEVGGAPQATERVGEARLRAQGGEQRAAAAVEPVDGGLQDPRDAGRVLGRGVAEGGPQARRGGGVAQRDQLRQRHERAARCPHRIDEPGLEHRERRRDDGRGHLAQRRGPAGDVAGEEVVAPCGERRVDRLGPDGVHRHRLQRVAQGARRGRGGPRDGGGGVGRSGEEGVPGGGVVHVRTLTDRAPPHTAGCGILRGATAQRQEW
ncbi:hypothetical protein I4I73_02365 [Pseudonocardia sp. KRD-184]|uniref:Uncharacterized protein n=1 Tax=Pseudonocardia oceani TaxID=2792013 RepID=A0ABS6UDY6_9PSEU|nr:hypothetical protein [Pseudonocardia oceani]MBW0088204.1 hypothetical protein [Pseudonocardia oceani]MBW0094843.1 hypothetical protein [Pseudonocardia oceani]MBW0107621.1 hypothetical protein [Pseudonocardia oceani]MBW0120996.1 hypothetical protein [Pseudonocardia oceani]MBW0130465.1 hypothetical protein [Pseudonocardia oceani]